MKVPRIPVFPESPYAAMFYPPTKSSVIELCCVGRASDNWIVGQSSVRWLLPVYEVRRKRFKVKVVNVRMKSYRRENLVNYVTYEVPENVICYYQRYVSTRPPKWEDAFFRVSNGVMEPLGTANLQEFGSLFMNDFGSIPIRLVD